METIFTKDKLADTTDFYVMGSAMHPVTLQVDGALGTDEITITGLGIDGTTETDLYDNAATPAILVLSASIPRITLDYPARLKLTMPVTTNDVGLMEIS